MHLLWALYLICTVNRKIKTFSAGNEEVAKPIWIKPGTDFVAALPSSPTASMITLMGNFVLEKRCGIRIQVLVRVAVVKGSSISVIPKLCEKSETSWLDITIHVINNLIPA